MEASITKPPAEAEGAESRLVVAYRKLGNRAILSSFLDVPPELDLKAAFEEFKRLEGLAETFYMWLEAKGVKQMADLNAEYREKAQAGSKEGRERKIYINLSKISAEPFELT